MKHLLKIRSTSLDSRKTNVRWSLSHAFALNLFGLAVPGLTALAVIPPTFKALGLEQFGVIALVWGALVVAGVLDLGIGRALTHKIASIPDDAPTRVNWLRAALLGALTFSLLLIALGLVLLSALALFDFLPSGFSDTFAQRKTIIILLVLIAPVHAMVVSVRGYYEGQGLFAKANLQRIVVNVSTLVLPLASSSLGGGLEGAVFGMLIVRVGAVAAVLIAIRGADHMVDGGNARSRVAELLRFGSLFSIESIIKGFASQADRYLIALLGGASLVAVFSLPSDLVLQALAPVGALTSALFPRFVAAGQDSNALATMVRWAALVFAISSALAVLMRWQVGNFFFLWLNDPPDGVIEIARVLIVGLPFYSVASIATAHLHAAKRLKETLGVSSVSAVGSVPLMYFLYLDGGVVAMAWYWPVKYFFEAAALLLLSMRRLA